MLVDWIHEQIVEGKDCCPSCGLDRRELGLTVEHIFFDCEPARPFLHRYRRYISKFHPDLTKIISLKDCLYDDKLFEGSMEFISNVYCQSLSGSPPASSATVLGTILSRFSAKPRDRLSSEMTNVPARNKVQPPISKTARIPAIGARTDPRSGKTARIPAIGARRDSRTSLR